MDISATGFVDEAPQKKNAYDSSSESDSEEEGVEVPEDWKERLGINSNTI
jgi:hypothetical protein